MKRAFQQPRIDDQVNRHIDRLTHLEGRLTTGERSALYGEVHGERDALARLADDAPEDIRQVIAYLVERYERLLRSAVN